MSRVQAYTLLPECGELTEGWLWTSAQNLPPDVEGGCGDMSARHRPGAGCWGRGGWRQRQASDHRCAPQGRPRPRGFMVWVRASVTTPTAHLLVWHS